MPQERRILIYGPQGSGKTLAANALQKKLGFEAVQDEITNADDIRDNCIGCGQTDGLLAGAEQAGRIDVVVLSAREARLLAGIHLHPLSAHDTPQTTTAEPTPTTNPGE